MTDTPPDGFVLDKNGKDVIITKFATVYSCNIDVNYGGVINSINGGTQTIKREFRYKKKDEPVEPGKPNTFINYYVTLSLSNGALNCKCDRITNIPGTNNGNVTLGIDITLSNGVGGYERMQFSWVMKNGINESKSCSMPYHYGSGFTTRSDWENDNGDGTKTYYTFYINHGSIPSRPNTKSL